jgi:hypothetical protein
VITTAALFALHGHLGTLLDQDGVPADWQVEHLENLRLERLRHERRAARKADRAAKQEARRRRRELRRKGR